MKNTTIIVVAFFIHYSVESRVNRAVIQNTLALKYQHHSIFQDRQCVTFDVKSN
jgi:hypothetical protein